VIPETQRGRTLVLCFDGTGDQFDEDNSNVVRLMGLLAKGDRKKQMVYYQAGIGTYTSEKDVSPWKAMIQKTLDEMVAWNLDEHVMDGYEFLMQNYHDGDRICIFGFSRGAHTARSLAGMLQKVGLLPADNWQQVPFAYKMYSRTDEEGFLLSASFKKTFSISVDIEFLGVWDTVSSVGLIPKQLPFTFCNNIVKTFRHALSLDEHRVKFNYEPWHRRDDKHLTRERSCRASQSVPNPKRRESTKSSFSVDSDIKVQSVLEDVYEEEWHDTDVEEVWFAGCHCDVGGGSVKNGTRHALANIPLRWMVRECFKTNSGILFNSKALREIGMDPSHIYPEVRPRPAALEPVEISYQIPSRSSLHKRIGESLTGLFRPSSKRRPTPRASDDIIREIKSEEYEDLHDSLSPVYDQLQLRRTWWILEYLPTKLHFKHLLKLHRGRPRRMHADERCEFKFHRTVRTRMNALSPRNGMASYRPRPGYPENIVWVD